MQKFLVIGSGFLGSYIANKISNTEDSITETIFSQKNEEKIRLDVRDVNACSEVILKINPDVIINCSAITDVDYLEKNLQKAFETNSTGARNLALIASKNKKRFIQISTDSVFDGEKGRYSENDKPNPLNVYAKSKVLAEKYISEISDNYLIVRTNFYGFNYKGSSLLDWTLNKLKNNEEVIGFNDVFFTPIEVSNLSSILIDLAKSEHNGILHVASNERISKFQFVQEVSNIFGLNTDLIRKGSINDVNLFAKRPKDTSLRNDRVRKISKIQIKSLKESLEEISKH